MASSACPTYATSPFNNPLHNNLQTFSHRPLPGLKTSGSNQSNSNVPDSAGGLTKAMSLVVIHDSCSRPGYDSQAMSQDLPNSQVQPGMHQNSFGHNQQQQATSSQGPNSYLQALPRRLILELSQTHSQELPLCTPDFATPGEQQHFMVDFEGAPGDMEDDMARSPAPSPRRHIKRPRNILADDASDTVSQQSQSQSRSQGEPSTCSKAGAPGKPPMHPNKGRHSMKRTHEPPVIRNPYLQPSDDLATSMYHPSNNNHIAIKQHRLFYDLKQEEKLGSGNFSEVVCCVHRMSGKRYALKKSKRPVVTTTEKNQWLAEVQALAAVEGHPNIVTFYDAWTEPADTAAGGGEWFFIRLELCGSSLGAQQQQQQNQHTHSGTGGHGRSRHAPRTPMKEPELLEVLKQMASALKHIHDLGLAHLDLKPDNIYRSKSQQRTPFIQQLSGAPSFTGALQLDSSQSQGTGGGGSIGGGGPGVSSTGTGGAGIASSPSLQLQMSQGEGEGKSSSGSRAGSQGSGEVYKLGDFGLACSKAAAAPVTEGDARYLAPELLSNNRDASLDKADLFALGATLYELATGASLPTGGDRYHALRQGQLMMMPCVSVKLQQIIKKLMSADPKERPTPDQLLRMPLVSGKNHST